MPVSTNSDAYSWIGSSGASWGNAADWQDLTSGQTPATSVPGANDPVTIAGPTGSIYEVISGGGASKSLGITGLISLIGSYTTGALGVGTAQATPVSGNLTLGAGASLQASTVTVADGTLALNGSGASLAASGVVTVGTPSSFTSNSTYLPGGSGTLSLAAGAGLTASSNLIVTEGLLTATGAGTTLSIGGNLVLGSPAPATNAGAFTYAEPGSLSVSGGASVSVAGAITDAYYQSSLTLAGAGSSLTAGTLTLDADSESYYISPQVTSGATLRVGGLSLVNSAPANDGYTTSLGVDSTSSVEIGSAGSAAAGAITIDAGITVATSVAATLSGNVVDKGTLSETGNTLTISGALSGAGLVQIGANATLALGGTAAASDTIAFTGAAGTLSINSSATSTYNSTTGSYVYSYTPYAVSATLSGFATGDGILVNNVTLTNAVYTYNGNNTGTLVLFAGTTAVETLTLAGNYTGRVFLVAPTTGSGSAVTLIAQPGNTVPSSEAVLAGLSTPLSGFSVSDSNATATSITVTLSDAHGLLSATSAGGGVVTGSGSTSLKISGTVTQVDADLATLSFLSNTTGTDAIVVSAIDSLGSASIQTSVPVTVLPVAPPTITVPSGVYAHQGTTQAISPVSITYPDGTVAGEQVSVTLSDGAGLLSLNAAVAGGGGTVAGSGTKSVSITGTLAQVNTDLSTLTYSSSAATGESVTVAASGTHGGTATPVVFDTTVDNYAAAALAALSSLGTLTQSGSAYTLQLGTVAKGSNLGTIQIGVTNTALTPADLLEGSFSGSSGDAAISFTGSTFSGIGAGETGDVLQATLDTTQAGTFKRQITLSPTGYNSSGYSGALAPETLIVTATVASLALAQVNTATPIDFGGVRAGTTLSRAVSISNIATSPAQSLDATATTSGQATVSGSIVQLAAGNTAASSITAGLTASTAGSAYGQILLSFKSDDGAGTVTPQPTQSETITVDATVYGEASASVSSPTIIVHVGDPGTASFAVKNNGSASYSDYLVAAVTGSTGSIAAIAGSSTGDIAPQATAPIAFSFDTSTAGLQSGTVLLRLQSDGTGLDNAGATVIGSTTASVAVAVDNDAVAEVVEVSGAPQLVGGSGFYTLDLGAVILGTTPLTVDLGVENGAQPIADVLGGSIGSTGDSAIAFASPGSFAGIGAQQVFDGLDLTLRTDEAGTFSRTIVVNAVGSNSSGYVGPTQTETITVTGTVDALAIPQVNTVSIDFGKVREGSDQSQAISISNAATPPSQSLDASASASGDASVVGSITGLSAGSTDDSSIVASLTTSSPGQEQGTVSLSFASDGGAGHITPLGGASQDVPVTGTVYQEAAGSAQFSLGTTILHVGDPGTATVVVTNTAPAPYSEDLVASVTGTSGAVSTTSTGLGPLAPQASDAIPITLDTSSAGTVQGQLQLAYSSDGTSTDGESATQVGTDNVPVNITISNYAQETLQSSDGSITETDGNYVIDLGELLPGKDELSDTLVVRI